MALGYSNSTCRAQERLCQLSQSSAYAQENEGARRDLEALGVTCRRKA